MIWVVLSALPLAGISLRGREKNEVQSVKLTGGRKPYHCVCLTTTLNLWRTSGAYVTLLLRRPTQNDAAC